MNEASVKTRISVRSLFLLCPIRHVLCLLGLNVICAYFSLRQRWNVMQAISDRIVRPWHRMMSRLCSHVSFSVAEMLIALAVILGILYIISVDGDFNVIRALQSVGYDQMAVRGERGKSGMEREAGSGGRRGLRQQL